MKERRQPVVPQFLACPPQSNTPRSYTTSFSQGDNSNSHDAVPHKIKPWWRAPGPKLQFDSIRRLLNHWRRRQCQRVLRRDPRLFNLIKRPQHLGLDPECDAVGVDLVECLQRRDRGVGKMIRVPADAAEESRLVVPVVNFICRSVNGDFFSVGSPS
jgi:hypothetical protein